MSTTTTPPPAPKRMVDRHTRDWGVRLIQTDTPQERQASQVTGRTKAILLKLLEAIETNGEVAMTSRAELKTSANMMQQLYYNGWVNGAGSSDARGSGNTPQSSWWWLTNEGEKIARLIAEKRNP